MKKRILSVALAAMVVTSLCACGSTEAPAEAATEVVEEATEAVEEVVEEVAEAVEEASEDVLGDAQYTIGICQLVQHVALDAATEGFMDACTAQLGDHVTFDLQNAAGDSATCATIANQFVSSNVDLIMANATPPLQAAAAATNEIPILGTSVTDYATALEISDWTGVTGTNISGTSDLAPLADQAAMLKELFPDATNVGLIYCSAEPNSQYQCSVIAEELAGYGYTTKDYTFADSNDIASVVTQATSECDVLYVPTDNTAAANTEVINNICLPAGIPVIAGEEGICAGCGVATLSISYYDLGYATGLMAARILYGGEDVTSMPVEFAPQVTKKYNVANCEALGITIPDDYVAIEE